MIISRLPSGGGEKHGATISVITSESTLLGKSVSLIKNGVTVNTKSFDSNGRCSFTNIQEVGTYKVFSSDGGSNVEKDVIIVSDNIVNKTIITVELTLLTIVAFATGTDEEIAKMIEAHYNNKINIADYWAVGDTRTVSLSAMAATGVGESHRAQDVQFVIGDFEHDDLATPINGHSKAAVTLLQKDCLMDATHASHPVHSSINTEAGYMNSTNTNTGGWKNCARRAWCNNVFFAALPRAWQSMVKTVNKKTSIGNYQYTIETVQDKIFLSAEIEIIGSATNSYDGEGAQYQYYKNAIANRYKMPKRSSDHISGPYFERSPYVNDARFCLINENGSASYNYANNAFGVAPCLCI